MSKAIFLGSFNPPHKGHLVCVQSVIESDLMNDLHIDQICIIPCYQNPNKDKQIDFFQRYHMTKLLFKNLINKNLVSVDNIEEDLQPKYTYELIEYLHSDIDSFIGSDFWWIITYETIQELKDDKWYLSKNLLRNNKFIVLVKNEFEKQEVLYNVNNINLKFIQINPLPIHSTQLRNKIQIGETIINETNEQIQKYIDDMNLYKDT